MLTASLVFAGAAMFVTAYAIFSAIDGHEDRRGFHPTELDGQEGRAGP